MRGLKPGTTRDMFTRAVSEDTVEELLHYFEPKAGDVIALPPGLVHAIGKGLIVAEVQQNSDVTLRIYDYKRKGLDGVPRKLHVKEALAAIRFDGPGDEFEGDMARDTIDVSVAAKSGPLGDELLTGRYFDLNRITLPSHSLSTYLPEGETEYPILDLKFPKDPARPKVLMVLNGEGEISGCEVKTGVTGLIPATSQGISIRSNGPMTLLLATPK